MLCCTALQVDDAQHPRNERYDDLPDDHLAVPRNSNFIVKVGLVRSLLIWIRQLTPLI